MPWELRPCARNSAMRLNPCCQSLSLQDLSASGNCEVVKLSVQQSSNPPSWLISASQKRPVDGRHPDPPLMCDCVATPTPHYFSA